jgi:diguanylate cyclase (GGDEF)-like protein
MLENPINQIYTPTGFFTPSVFTILLQHEIARTERYPSPISLAILSVITPAPLTDEIREGADILFFKILRTKLRQTDIISKYGENYLILLTSTDQTGAQIAIRRVLEHLNTSIVTKHNQKVNLGVCAGLASYLSGTSTTAETLLERASQSHHAARTSGPGVVVVANP